MEALLDAATCVLGIDEHTAGAATAQAGVSGADPGTRVVPSLHAETQRLEGADLRSGR
jgi:hypothetical protein